MAKRKEEKTITIECRGADERPVEELIEFQGELKSLTKERLKKLKNSIVKRGWSAPIFVWQRTQKSKAYIIDGHQRIKALASLKEDGYKIPEKLPVDYIKAKSKKEAKEKLLAIVSQFGKISNRGARDFFIGLDFDSLSDSIHIPELKIQIFDDEPEVELSAELMESHNYIVLYFDNDIDWLQAQTLFELKAVRSLHHKLKQVGMGRVLPGPEAIQKLMKVRK